VPVYKNIKKSYSTKKIIINQYKTAFKINKINIEKGEGS
jgi:hypothetical protein